MRSYQHILSVAYYIYRRKAVFYSVTSAQSMMRVNDWVHCGIELSNYIIPFSSLWYKMHVGYSVKCVFKIKLFLLVVFYTINGTACIILHISLLIIMRLRELYFVIIIKSQIWIISYCLYLNPWNNGMRCMSYRVPMTADVLAPCLLTLCAMGPWPVEGGKWIDLFGWHPR